MDSQSHEPFVLRARKRIPGRVPDSSRIFDTRRQLWLFKESGLPVVSELTRPSTHERSAWGETILTKTSEGVDQSEGSQASDWGETVMTETSEGIDQSETVISSNFGETVVTATSEGLDQSERISDVDRY